MENRHFQVVEGDKSLLMKEGRPMSIIPAAFSILHTKDDSLIFGRDNREKLLGFAGGGIEIGKETPDMACIRECLEEFGITILLEELDFVGQFGKLEPIHLFVTHTWGGTPYIADPREVLEILEISIVSILKNPLSYRGLFYPAQWKMLGWYLNHYLATRKPLFERWEGFTRNPWPQLVQS